MESIRPFGAIFHHEFSQKEYATKEDNSHQIFQREHGFSSNLRDSALYAGGPRSDAAASEPGSSLITKDAVGITKDAVGGDSSRINSQADCVLSPSVATTSGVSSFAGGSESL